MNKNLNSNREPPLISIPLLELKSWQVPPTVSWRHSHQLPSSINPEPPRAVRPPHRTTPSCLRDRASSSCRCCCSSLPASGASRPGRCSPSSSTGSVMTTWTICTRCPGSASSWAVEWRWTTWRRTSRVYHIPTTTPWWQVNKQSHRKRPTAAVCLPIPIAKSLEIWFSFNSFWIASYCVHGNIVPHVP